MGKLLYGHTNSLCQCNHRDSQVIISLSWYTGVLFSVIVDHAYDVFRFFFSILTFGASANVRGGLKDSSHEFFQVIFDCDECGITNARRTIEFGPYGCRMVKGYYKVKYSTTATCGRNASVTFGDLRWVLDYYKKNMGDYVLSTNNCYTFCSGYYESLLKQINSNAYVIVSGENGFEFNLPIQWRNNNGSSKAIEAANKESQRVLVTAIGPGGRGFTAFANGYAQWTACNAFSSKITEIEVKEIKQVVFGPYDTWMILMNNGWVYGEVLSSLKTIIEKFNGDIKYVASSAIKDQWIAGFGSNGYRSKGLSKSLLSRLNKTHKAKKSIYWVELGKTAERYVMHDENGWEWTFEGKSSDFSKYIKANDIRLITIY
eukprot:460770_1